MKSAEFSSAVKDGGINYIDSDVMDSYIAEVKNQSVLFGDDINRDVAIVYSPLNGTGLKPVTRVLSEGGFTNITVVEEQKIQMGYFQHALIRILRFEKQWSWD